MKSLLNLTLLAAIITIMAACGGGVEGEKVEAGKAEEVKENEATTATYAVDVANSTITWAGSSANGAHNGTIGLSEGSLDVDGEGAITGGSFTIDITSLENVDLADNPKKKGGLEGHLKSGDFFDAEKFPTGKFVITSVTPVEGVVVEDGFNPTHEITGNLTLKETEKSITFKANIANEGGTIKATSNQFVIDRSAWGVDDESLKDKLINNDVGITISLSAAAGE